MISITLSDPNSCDKGNDLSLSAPKDYEDFCLFHCHTHILTLIQMFSAQKGKLLVFYFIHAFLLQRRCQHNFSFAPKKDHSCFAPCACYKGNMLSHIIPIWKSSATKEDWKTISVHIPATKGICIGSRFTYYASAHKEERHFCSSLTLSSAPKEGKLAWWDLFQVSDFPWFIVVPQKVYAAILN